MINGVLNVYKEAGFTSFDVVAKLRGIVGQRKIGHTGTLDPDAVGVLPVCLGRATKLVDLLTDKRKTYEAVILLGKTTDTQDLSGEVLSEGQVPTDTALVESCIMSFLGEQEQIPPMYSALKVNGQKLCDLARQGKVVDRKARRVCFYEIDIIEMDLPRVKISVTCSKGTYIRTLCHDIGQKLGCGACMEHLTRTKVDAFSIEHALTLSQIEALRDQGCLMDAVVSIDKIFEHLPSYISKNEADLLCHNGNKLASEHLLQVPDHPEDGSKARIYDSEHAFIGVFSYDSKSMLWVPVKIFYDNNTI